MELKKYRITILEHNYVTASVLAKSEDEAQEIYNEGFHKYGDLADAEIQTKYLDDDGYEIIKVEEAK